LLLVHLQKTCTNRKFPVTMDVCCILKTCVQMVSGCEAFVPSFAYTEHEQSSLFRVVWLWILHTEHWHYAGKKNKIPLLLLLGIVWPCEPSRQQQPTRAPWRVVTCRIPLTEVEWQKTVKWYSNQLLYLALGVLYKVLGHWDREIIAFCSKWRHQKDKSRFHPLLLHASQTSGMNTS
jgi:hypothetical protein